MKDVVAIIMGGGGDAPVPAHARPRQPAVPVAGACGLIDIPLSNCINSDITKVFALTQYNSASLQPARRAHLQLRHAQRGRRGDPRGGADALERGLVPGTADAVRRSLRHVLTGARGWC
jgi:glucose-1-phosphate adenylyltransferase